MKVSIFKTLTVFLCLFWAGVTLAFAQQQTNQAPGQQQGMTADQADPAHSAQWIDKPLIDVTGQQLGTVSEVITSEGRISYVLVKTDDDNIHPVPAQHIYTGAEGQRLQATFERRHFSQSPGFSAEQAKQMKQQDWEQEVQGYYGRTEMQEDQERK